MTTERAPTIDTKSFRGGFLLYRKAGGGPSRKAGAGKTPRFRHPTFASAEMEAKRLLSLHPESTLVILQEIARVKLKPAATEAEALAHHLGVDVGHG